MTNNQLAHSMARIPWSPEQPWCQIHKRTQTFAGNTTISPVTTLQHYSKPYIMTFRRKSANTRRKIHWGRLGQGLPPYQVASWSLQPFGHNTWATIRGGVLCPQCFGGEEQGSHLTQCRLGWGLSPYQVASIQPFGHNRHGPKIGGCDPFGWGGAGSPSNTMWPGPRPTSMTSSILIHPTDWPQYTNVTNRTGNGLIT